MLPPQNRSFLPPGGIRPGAVVLTDVSAWGGVVATGVQVIYADARAFTFITPQDHPRSGWTTFAAYEDGGNRVLQIQGLARAGDPLYELAFRLSGTRTQGRVWRHVLNAVAARLEVSAEIRVGEVCLDQRFQWERAANLWYNARIRGLPYQFGTGARGAAPNNQIREK